MTIDLWNQLAGRAGLTLSGAQHERFGLYLDLLEAGNQRMNLTRITGRGLAEVSHIGDALTLLAYLPAGGGFVADVGAGGGVPGMVLAIARPDVGVTLIEATKKKAVFLAETAQELGLQNVTVVGERAEDAGHDPELRESFDVVVCRAVATMSWLCEWCLPLVKKGGKMLAMKGPKAAEELPLAEHAIALVGGGSPNIRPVDLPGTRSHVIVEIAKIGKTPKAYPRLAPVAKGKAL